MKINKKQCCFLLLLLFFSWAFTLFGANDVFLRVLFSFVFLLSMHTLSKRLFAVVFVFIWISSLFLLSTVLLHGQISWPMIVAFFDTNAQEATEYLSSMPWWVYPLSLFWLALGYAILRLALESNAFYWGKSTKPVALFLLLFVVLLNPMQHYIKHQKVSFAKTKPGVLHLYAHIYQQHREFLQELHNFKEYSALKPSWQISQVEPAYKNYVLVIGESVRRDYMQAYGFPLPNTPFMHTASGVVLDGYTAAAAHTVVSLVRTIVQNKENTPLYANNIITLAKQAGFHTVWISGQGTFSQHDTPIYSIGARSDEVFFAKDKIQNFTGHDVALLPHFKEILQKPQAKPRLIVIHLQGSHPSFEQRLHSPLTFDYHNQNISQYVQTIAQTDELLAQLHQSLLTQGESFSLMYFADHGLVTKKGLLAKDTSLRHGISKGSYQVPFAVFSSDDTTHKLLKTKKSAFQFMHGFAHWLGIKEPTLRTDYQFFSTIEDTLEVFNGKENVPLESILTDSVLPKHF